MTSDILKAHVWLDEYAGVYWLQIKDFLNDTTYEERIPDEYIGYLPLIMNEIQKKLG